jgi:hypothetical protein
MPDHPTSIEEIRHIFRNIFAGEDCKEKSNSEPVFVSFDIAHGNQKGMGAIGVSIFDTRCFTGSIIPRPKNHKHPLLWTRTYVFNYGPQGVRRAKKRALFDGDAQKVTVGDRILLLRHIFSYHKEEDVETCCQSQKFRPFQPSGTSQSPSRVGDRRPIIAVGHAIHQDLRSLSKAGFSIEQVAPVLAVIDTQKIAQELYWKDHRSRNVSLQELCKLMGFQPTKLHTSGNDAAYTLTVLLSLASKILGNEEEGADAQDILEELVQIALDSAKTTKGKRKARSRGEQYSKDWAENLDGKNI